MPASGNDCPQAFLAEESAVNMAAISRADDDAAKSELEVAISAARAGDSAARWRALDTCRQYLRLVVGKNRWPGRANESATSDLVHDTLLEGWRGFGRFKGSTPGQLRAWLRVTLIHSLIKRRRRPPISRLETGSEGAAIAASNTPASLIVERADSNEAVEKALRGLPQHYQAVIEWRLWNDLSFAEIGSRLGMSDDSAQKLYARAIARLRKLTGSSHGSD
jgi:RNA polymerase sigma factor (sigma-70 family)